MSIKVFETCLQTCSSLSDKNICIFAFSSLHIYNLYAYIHHTLYIYLYMYTHKKYTYICIEIDVWVGQDKYIYRERDMYIYICWSYGSLYEHRHEHLACQGRQRLDAHYLKDVRKRCSLIGVRKGVRRRVCRRFRQ